MSVQCLVFVRADGSTERTLVDSYPERWIVRDGVPYERGAIAWRLDEGVAEPHGAMVYAEVEPKRYVAERARAQGEHDRALRELTAMPAWLEPSADSGKGPST